jgi:LacI family transcriptional regulator
MYQNTRMSSDEKGYLGFGPASREATLASVATRAGVSTATVARVLRGHGYVAETTRERVRAALAATGYRPNEHARSLRTQRSLILGLLLSSIGLNPLFAEIARAVENEAERQGYRVLIVNLEADPARERDGVLRLIDSRVEAMVFIHALLPENVALAAKAGIPVVQVERLVSGIGHSVVVDNKAGCTAAMRHLLELGHSRIGYIGVDPAGYRRLGLLSIESERLGSYRDALSEAGLPVDSDLVRLSERYPLERSVREGPAPGYAQMLDLLDQPSPPSAVLVTGDVLSTGVLQALYERGLRVPDDMSVIGYDDNLAPYLAPPLTAVALPTQAMGEAACVLALEAIAGGTTPRGVTLPTTLRIRRSTGPAGAA